MSTPKLKKKIERMYSIKRFSQITEQKEFGAVKAANKAAKKAWEKSQVGTSMFKPNVKGVRAWNKSLMDGSKVDASINVKEMFKNQRDMYPVKGIIKASRSL